MLLGLLMGVGAFFSILLMGIPFVPLFGGARRWRPYAPLDKGAVARIHGDMMLFDSVEDQMEDFSLAWPSEVPRAETRFPDLPWPSEGWNDPAFGAQARADYAANRERNAAGEENARQSGLAPPSKQQQQQQQKKKPKQDKPVSAPQPPPQQAQRSTVPVQTESLLHGGRTPQPADVREKKEKRAKITPKPAPPRQGGAPSPDEVAKLVQDLGLAGAVEKIRLQTGWDFKKSAQYLATVLKDHK